MLPEPAPPRLRARLERALGNAQTALFSFRPGQAGAAADWRWSGARFGIPHIERADGGDRLLAAVSAQDRLDVETLLFRTTPDCARSSEFRIASPEGSARHLCCDAYAEAEDGGRIVFGIVQDMTNQRRFEAELTELVRRNHMLLAAIDVCPVSITVGDALRPDMPLIYVNRSFSEMTGYAADEAIGRNCRFLQGAATSPAAVAAMRHAIATQTSCDVQLTNYRKNGTTFLNRFILAPLHDHAGQVTAYIGLQSDITLDAKRKDIESQRQKMEALGRMMGGVAHEISNMLQPVALLGRDLLDRALVAPAGEAHLGIVIDCVGKARQIIADLLAFSRPSTPRIEHHDPAEMLADALRIVHQAVPPTISLAVRTEGQPPRVAMDRTRFVQILLNLVANAAAAMNSVGAITILLDDHPGPVEGDAPPHGGRFARLRVCDTGCGMDKITLDRALEPFFTTKPVGQGTGLGLPVVYGFVRDMGGTVTLDSAPGRGTVVTILIPGREGDKADGNDPDR